MTEQIKQKPKQKLSTETSIPSFIKKIYEILEGRKCPEIIDWSADGTALIIKSPMEFCHKVLPLYFKHNNLTSFIRQLNMYNFRKRRTQEMDHIYCHELFQKGKRHLLKEIKRKNHDPIRFMQKTMDSLDNTVENQTDNSNASQENHLLKSLNKDALARIGSAEKKCKNLTSQNQALWQKVCAQHEREELLKGLLMSVMKHFGVSTNQFPMLIKTYPHLFLSGNKLEKDELLKEFSLEFPNSFKERPAGNSFASLQRNIEIPELKDLSQAVSNPMNFMDLRAYNRVDQFQANLEKFQNIQDFGMYQRDFEMSQYTNPSQWNFELELQKRLKVHNQQNNMFNGKTELLDIGLLAKRPFDYETDDQHSLDSNFESTESYINGNWLARRELANPSYSRDCYKYLLMKNIKREEFETHPKIEIVDF